MIFYFFFFTVSSVVSLKSENISSSDQRTQVYFFSDIDVYFVTVLSSFSISLFCNIVPFRTVIYILVDSHPQTLIPWLVVEVYH